VCQKDKFGSPGQVQITVQNIGVNTWFSFFSDEYPKIELEIRFQVSSEQLAKGKKNGTGLDVSWLVSI